LEVNKKGKKRFKKNTIAFSIIGFEDYTLIFNEIINEFQKYTSVLPYVKS
jgi:hypothetical protein